MCPASLGFWGTACNLCYTRRRPSSHSGGPDCSRPRLLRWQLGDRCKTAILCVLKYMQGQAQACTIATNHAKVSQSKCEPAETEEIPWWMLSSGHPKRNPLSGGHVFWIHLALPSVQFRFQAGAGLCCKATAAGTSAYGPWNLLGCRFFGVPPFRFVLKRHQNELTMLGVPPFCQKPTWAYPFLGEKPNGIKHT